MSTLHNALGARASLETSAGTFEIYRLDRLEAAGLGDVGRLPVSLRVLLENLLRHCDGRVATEEDVAALAGWTAAAPDRREIPFMPGRVLLQDFTGVPVVADLAALRGAVRRLGGDPGRVNPIVPVDLVIDHSVQVDVFGRSDAVAANVDLEYQRNRERYAFLRWAQRAFRNFRVVPPGAGIVHQVNLEHLAQVIQQQSVGGRTVVFPDTVVGTDSHTTMINGLGVLGWGVGGIEAEAVMLGQPFTFVTPAVVGVRFIGQLQPGVTATDLVLTVTQMLRKKGVVDKFVEFFGPGLSSLPLADRATLANMAPEYGATCGFFPVDAETLRYLWTTGRDPALIDLVERYTKEQGIFRTDETPDPVYSDAVELDLATVEPSLAGPRRPQDRVPLGRVGEAFRTAFSERLAASPSAAKPADGGNGQASAGGVEVAIDGKTVRVGHGAVVIAAITSCTNTSNPSVLIGAGLVAKKAVERGLSVKPYVKTSLAPGSRAVTGYLQAAGLLPYLEAIGFHVVGYGCTTCIGNSGPLPEPVAAAVRERDLVAAAVLSGNRNFEGRIHPLARAAFLASPPLVVAYALAGTVDVDLTSEPVGHDRSGQPVYLRDLWPSSQEIREALDRSLTRELFERTYATVSEGDERWQTLVVPGDSEYVWDPASTYIQEPPFLQGVTPSPLPIGDVRGAHVLAVLGDSVTTDHISPAGSFAADGPAGRYLRERGVAPAEFNSFGARRGNHEVMMRGTLANVRLRNQLVSRAEGGVTIHLPSGERMSIFDAAARYQSDGVPLVIIAGREYGTGSSRDWAAKGVALLGVRLVIAESYERIHRSNLVGMGVLPLQFLPGQNRETFGLTGREVIDVEGVAENLAPRRTATVRARREDGSVIAFPALVRLDSPMDVEYFRHGGILPAVLRSLLTGATTPA